MDLQEKTGRKKTAELIQALDSLFDQRPDYFYSKWSTKYSDTNQNLSFKTSVRMKTDSAVNALITYAGIPIYQALLTKDTLLISNKRNKCYSKTNLSFFQNNFGYPFTFSNIEELFMGIPLAYDSTQRYYQINNPYYHVISSHRKHEIKKHARNIKFAEENEIIIKYYLNNDLNRLEKIEIESPEDETNVLVEYISREFIKNFNIPKEVLIKVSTPKNTINVRLEYEKTEINEEQNLNVIIPSSYEVCP